MGEAPGLVSVRERGQTTVELALCLPIVALVLGAVAEIGGLSSDAIRVWHAAREAARVAAVEPESEAAVAAAEAVGLEGLEVTVRPAPEARVAGDPVSVAVEYEPPGRLPLLAAVVSRLRLRADAVMRIEQP